MNRNDIDDERDAATIGALLGRVGTRPQPSAEAARAVRAAVEAEWRAQVDARHARRRHTTWFAAAATVAAVAIGAWIAWPGTSAAPVTVATLGPVVGTVEMRTGDGAWHAAATGSAVTSDTELRSGPAGRAALALANGVSVRIDTGTTLAFAGRDGARLEGGAVYVDSGTGPPADFVIETPAGDVRHLGTQYLARVDGGSVEVGVREGRVEVQDRGRALTARAGELLTIQGADVRRSPLPPSGAAWDWIGEVTPAYSIEGRTVSDFLAWAARESGRQVAYATPADAELAGQVTLSGTVEGLPPSQAVSAVLATTSLTARFEDGRIEVSGAH
ncbi:MAG: FecR family protein [Steroidobacteraceae bacterium]